MGIHATSFLLGIGAAWLLPILSRAFRPFAVQATVVSMGLFDEARRVAAEQAELMEDILAEARARREEQAAEHEEEAEEGVPVEVESPGRERARRRGNGVRRRAS